MESEDELIATDEMNLEQQPAKPVEPSRRTVQRKFRDRLIALAIGGVLAGLVAIPLDLVFFDFGWSSSATEFGSQYPRDPVAGDALERGPGGQYLLVLEREALVLEELGQGTDLPDWAGSYGYGNGYVSHAIDIAPGSGFAYRTVGCLGLQGQSSGHIRAAGSRIYLESELPSDSDSSSPAGIAIRLSDGRNAHDEYVFIPWGNRKYLIARDQMIAFAIDAKSSLDSRSWPIGPYFVSYDVEASVPEELPEVPIEFAEAFSTPGIRARVLEVLGSEATENPHDDAYYVRVLLDLSREQGAYAELELVPADPYVGFMIATVVELEAECTVAKIYVSEAARHPEVDWVFVPNRRQ